MMTRLMTAGEGRLLVRVSAAFFCVRNKMSLTKLGPALTSSPHNIAADVDVVRKFAAYCGFTHGYTVGTCATHMRSA